MYKEEIKDLDETINKIKLSIKNCKNASLKDNLRKRLFIYEQMRSDLYLQQRHCADKGA